MFATVSFQTSMSSIGTLAAASDVVMLRRLAREDCWIQLKISAAGLRLVNKVGLDAALKQAVAKGRPAALIFN